MLRKLSALFIIAVFCFLPQRAFAVSTPNFSSCGNPQGNLKVSYDSGVHGIVGHTGVYQGSDKVYTLSDTTLMQCYCDGNGGIQTDWWKVSELDPSEIEELKSQGWIYIPNGALWGLDEAPYLAKNSNFGCGGGSSSSGGGGGSSSGGEAVLGVSAGGNITTFASTGNLGMIVTLLGFGISSLLIGIFLQKNSK